MTLPGDVETITDIATLPQVTVTLPAVTEVCSPVTETLPAVTETLPAVTETFPAITETLPAITETLPAVTETLPAVTETLPAVTETAPPVTETLPASTVTTTTTTTATLAPSTTTITSCPTGDPIRNGGFESALPGSWTVLTAGDADVSRIAVTGGYALGARINSGNANLPQRAIQAVSICPGVNYQVSFSARRVTTVGVVSATLYVNDTPLAGGVVTSTAFTNVFVINGGIFSSTAGVVTVRLEFTYSGNPGSSKEVQVDNVVFTPL